MPSARGRRRVPGEARPLDDAADQRKAVGVQARRGEAQHDVSLGDVGRRKQPAALDRADGEAGEIVVAAGVHARHLRGLAADQGAAGLPAALGDAGDDRRALIGIEPAGGEIVEEEQRLGALHDEVVDAHGDEVDADRVVPAGFDGDLELGADAVVGGDEDRIGKAGGLEVEQPAEAADLAVGARPAGRAHQRLDLLDHGVAGIDVDACVAVGQTVPALAHLALPRGRPARQLPRGPFKRKGAGRESARGPCGNGQIHPSPGRRMPPGFVPVPIAPRRQ